MKSQRWQTGTAVSVTYTFSFRGCHIIEIYYGKSHVNLCHHDDDFFDENATKWTLIKMIMEWRHAWSDLFLVCVLQALLFKYQLFNTRRGGKFDQDCSSLTSNCRDFTKGVSWCLQYEGGKCRERTHRWLTNLYQRRGCTKKKYLNGKNIHKLVKTLVRQRSNKAWTSFSSSSWLFPWLCKCCFCCCHTLGQIMDHNFSLSNKKQFSQIIYRLLVCKGNNVPKVDSLHSNTTGLNPDVPYCNSKYII